MPKNYLLIDGMNIGHAAQSMQKLHVGSAEVQAIYGFIRTIRQIIETYPQADPIVLWDGASWRKNAFPDYKLNRDKNDTVADQKKLAEKEAFRAQKKHIQTAMRLIGIPQVLCMNYEADDLAGILVERAERKGDKVMLISGDQDWVQLVGPSVTWFDPIRDKKVSPANLEATYGVKTTEQFLQLKALQGDSGDNLPPVGGIGPKTAVKLLAEFESIPNLLNLMVEGAVPKQPKLVEDFLRSNEKQEIFDLNMRLMRLRSGPHRPAPVQMTVTKPVYNPAAFQTFCERLMFKRFLKAFEEWLNPFHRVALRNGVVQ